MCRYMKVSSPEVCSFLLVLRERCDRSVTLLVHYQTIAICKFLVYDNNNNNDCVDDYDTKILNNN